MKSIACGGAGAVRAQPARRAHACETAYSKEQLHRVHIAPKLPTIAKTAITTGGGVPASSPAPPPPGGGITCAVLTPAVSAATGARSAAAGTPRLRGGVATGPGSIGPCCSQSAWASRRAGAAAEKSLPHHTVTLVKRKVTPGPPSVAGDCRSMSYWTAALALRTAATGPTVALKPRPSVVSAGSVGVCSTSYIQFRGW